MFSNVILGTSFLHSAGVSARPGRAAIIANKMAIESPVQQRVNL
jgi:hypothetical protein